VTKRWKNKDRKLESSTMQVTLFFDRMDSKNAEKYWIRLMNQGCPELLAEFQKHSLEDTTIGWIFYWYFHQKEFPSGMTFNEIMLELVQPREMSFPSHQPPKIFSDNKGSRRKDCSLYVSNWCLSVNSILEICLIMDSPPDVPPAAKVLAKSFRSICVRQKGNDIICERFFEIFINPTIHSFLVKSMLASRKAYFIQKLEPEYALKKKNPGLRKYFIRFTQKHLLRLKNLPFWNLLIRRIIFDK
jgi:hypothetical protein